MKNIFCAIFALSAASLFAGGSDYKAYLGGHVIDKIAVARSLGIKYISFDERRIWHILRSDKGEICFYLKDPESILHVAATYPVDDPEKASADRNTRWRDLCVLLDPSAPFPQNFAGGKPRADGKIILPWNYRRKPVVGMVVARIMARINAMEKSKTNKKMKFGGFVFTDPRLSGEFYKTAAGGEPAKISIADNVVQDNGKPFDYKTYAEGRLEFLKALRKAARAVNADVKFVFETSDIRGDFLDFAESVPDFKTKYADAIPDLVVSSGSTAKLLDESNFKSGILRRDMVSSSSLANVFDPAREAAEIAALAQCGASSSINLDPPQGDILRYGNIPARLRISRLIPAMEILNNTPLDARRYDAKENVYSSPNAFISAKAAGFRKPNTNNYFIVFIAGGGKIKLPDGYTVDTFEYVNGFFGSTVGHHHRKPMGAVYEKGEKLFRMRHWMSLSKPVIFSEKGGYITLANETFAGEIFMLTLKPSK